MSAWLLQYSTDGGKTWQQQPLNTGLFQIGRTHDNHFAIEHPQVSRHHAQLRVEPDGVWLVDQNASNGVTLNGQRIPAGQWVTLQTGAVFTVGPAHLRVAHVTQNAASTQIAARPTAAKKPAAPKPASKSVLKWAGVGGILLVCLCLVMLTSIAAWWFYPNWLPQTANNNGGNGTTAATAPPAATPVPLQTLRVNPGGSVQDEYGASLNLPADIVEAGQTVDLQQARLSETMVQNLSGGYTVQGLAYSVQQSDGNDGLGAAALSLPASGPQDKLAVLIDNRFVGILETPQENGAFTVRASLSLPIDAQTYVTPDSGAEQAPNRYFVVTPKTGASSPGGGVLASRTNPQEYDGVICIAEFFTLSRCMRNVESSVYVFWQEDYPDTLKDSRYGKINAVIDAVQAIYQKYQQAGFTAAAISPSNPVYVVVEAGATSPYYSFKTGNIYIPWDIVGNISTTKERCTMAHEIFHWIEDEEYRMGFAAVSSTKTWWLETSADNGSFLLDSACIDETLKFYGIATTNENLLGFQSGPQQWVLSGEPARYIHSVALYLTLCEGGSGCSMSQKTWAEAINAGSYPFEGTALRAYQNNTYDLARYLLGAPPIQSRADAYRSPVTKTGGEYGDYMLLKTGSRGIFDYGLPNGQFSPDGSTKVRVTAQIEHGGVYPLWIGNGDTTARGNRSSTGLPGFVEIEGGPAFWVRIGTQEPVYYPEGSKLAFGVLSEKMGIAPLRVVAIAPNSAQTFKASLSVADFSGDWQTKFIGTPKITPINCPSYEAGDGEMSSDEDAFLAIFSGYGTYVRDSAVSDGSHYVWQGTLPQGMLGNSEITVKAENITLKYRIEIPKPASHLLPDDIQKMVATQQPKPSAGWLLVVALPGAAVGALWRKQIWVRRAATLWLCALMLGGCVGIGIWGTFEGTYTFNKVDYVGENAAQLTTSGATASSNEEVLWQLSGSGEITFDLTIEVSASVMGEEGDPQTSQCVLGIQSDLQAQIGPADMVTPPDLGGE